MSSLEKICFLFALLATMKRTVFGLLVAMDYMHSNFSKQAGLWVLTHKEKLIKKKEGHE